MGTLKSEYLNKEFATRDTEAGSILTHGTLENIVHDIAPQMEKPIKYHYAEPRMFEPGHFVVFCTMTDEGGQRRVEAIGEASESSLETEIAKKFPVLIATQRAFDRAAIRFLAFPGKAYSDSEIPIGDQAPEPDPRKQEKPAAEPKPEPASKAKAEPAEKPKAENKQAAKPEPEPSQEPGKIIKYEDIPVKLGRHKNKGYTISQLAKEDYASLEWIAGYTPRRPEDAEQVEAAKKWIAEHKSA